MRATMDVMDVMGVIKSGVLRVISCDSKYSTFQSKLHKEMSEQKVAVVVYKTSSEHFAVVYPHWGLMSAKRPFCMVNLKRARVERSQRNPNEFSISSNRDSGLLSLVLCTSDPNSDPNSDDMQPQSGDNSLQGIQSWIDALKGECKDCDSSAHDGKCYSRRRVAKSSLLSVLNEDNEDYII